MNFTKHGNNLLLVSWIAVIGTILATTTIIYSWSTVSQKERKKKSKNRQTPDIQMEFVEAGKVEELYIYPIKSCKPNKVQWLDCGERGSRYGDEQDRHFLIVDSMLDNLFLTARIYPKMVLIEAHVVGHTLQVHFPKDNPSEYDTIDDSDDLIEVDLEEVRERNHVRRARFFNDSRTEGLDCGDHIGEALDHFLGVKGKRALRLIWFANEKQLYTERDRPSKPEYWANNAVPVVHDKVGYADLASYMAFSLGSVDDLNAHLTPQNLRIDARNFRPNLVVSGLPPYDEDRWLRVKAGDAEFVCYKPCTRCVLTTVNPDSGEKSDKLEPLRELRKYRLAPGKLYDLYKESPVFGVNMAIAKPGRVSVGDTVFIQYKPNPF